MPVCDLIHSSSLFVFSTINFSHVTLVFASVLLFFGDLSTFIHVEVLYFLLRSHLSLEPFVSNNIIHRESFVGFFLSHTNNEFKGVFRNVYFPMLNDSGGIFYPAHPVLVDTIGFSKGFLARKHHEEHHS
jgi:hypothetical protein